MSDAKKAVAAYAAYEEYAGQGVDDLGRDEKGLPFLDILQKQSPEIDELEGAAPGLIINKATKELSKTIRFVPVCREHVYNEWVPRDAGGGRVGTHPVGSPIVAAARKQRAVGKVLLDNGNELIETFYLFGLTLDAEDTPTPAVISFTSTKIPAYRTLATRSDALMFTAKDGRKLKFPWFSHVWRLGTEQKRKDKYSWFTWTTAFDGENDRADEGRLPPTSPIVAMGADMFASHKAEGLKLKEEEAPAQIEEMPKALKELGKDEIPF